MLRLVSTSSTPRENKISEHLKHSLEQLKKDCEIDEFNFPSRDNRLIPSAATEMLNNTTTHLKLNFVRSFKKFLRLENFSADDIKLIISNKLYNGPSLDIKMYNHLFFYSSNFKMDRDHLLLRLKLFFEFQQHFETLVVMKRDNLSYTKSTKPNNSVYNYKLYKLDFYIRASRRGPIKNKGYNKKNKEPEKLLTYNQWKKSEKYNPKPNSTLLSQKSRSQLEQENIEKISKLDTKYSKNKFQQLYLDIQLKYGILMDSNSNNLDETTRNVATIIQSDLKELDAYSNNNDDCFDENFDLDFEAENNPLVDLVGQTFDLTIQPPATRADMTVSQIDGVDQTTPENETKKDRRKYYQLKNSKRCNMIPMIQNISTTKYITFGKVALFEIIQQLNKSNKIEFSQAEQGAYLNYINYNQKDRGEKNKLLLNFLNNFFDLSKALTTHNYVTTKKNEYKFDAFSTDGYGVSVLYELPISQVQKKKTKTKNENTIC